MRRLNILTNSAEKTFRTCQRLYEIQYEECYRTTSTPEPLAFGTLTHLGLEAWWRAAKLHPTDQDAWLRAAATPLEGERDPFRKATAEALLAGYHQRWSAMTWEGGPNDGAPIEVIGVEVEFNGPLVNPDTGAASKTWLRGGKIDVMIRVLAADRPVYVVEHKTSSEDFGPGTAYRSRLTLDTQVSGYHVGARLLGHHGVAGVLYDVIGKPSFRPHKATPMDKRKYTKGTTKESPRLYAGQRERDETPDEFQSRLIDSMSSAPHDYFARFEVVRLREEEAEAARDTWNYGLMIRDARRLKRWPRNPSACSAPGRVCAFLPVCEGTASLSDGIRYRKAETAHEELSGEGEKEAA